MRTVLIQQRILAGRSAVLRERLVASTEKILTAFASSSSSHSCDAHTSGSITQNGVENGNCASDNDDDNILEQSIGAAALLEAAMMETAYGYTAPAKVYTDRAMEKLGLHAELGGALGTRTAHQQDPRAQLILKFSVLRNSKNENNDDDGGGGNGNGVDGAVLDAFLMEGSGSADDMKGFGGDSDVLRHPKLITTTSSPTPASPSSTTTLEGNSGMTSISENGHDDAALPAVQLTPLQQAAVLALGLYAKKGSSADGLQPWEVFAHADAVLQQAKSEFLVRAAAHLQVSRVERQRSRTRERALLGLEGLAESLDRQSMDVGVAARMRYVFWVFLLERKNYINYLPFFLYPSHSATSCFGVHTFIYLPIHSTFISCPPWPQSN